MNMGNWNEWQLRNSKIHDLHQLQEIKGKTSPEMYKSLEGFLVVFITPDILGSNCFKKCARGTIPNSKMY